MAESDWTLWDTLGGAIRTDLILLGGNLYVFASDAKLYQIDEESFHDVSGGANFEVTSIIVG